MWPFSRSEKRTISSVPWAGSGWDTGGRSPWDGISQERAVRCVPVFGAIRFLADNIAAMAPGLGLYKLGKGDIAERQPTPSLFANPSIHGTLFDWLHRAVISMGFHGDGIGLITARDYLGFPTMIEWLNPLNVQTLDRAIEGPGSYVDPRWYWWGRPMDPKDLLHIPWFCLPWRVRGLSPMSAFASSVGIYLGAQEFTNEWFQHGGVPPGTFRNTQQKVLPDDTDEIMAKISRRIRTRQTLVYGMDWEYNPIAISPQEAKFVEIQQLSATQIGVIYGVPAHQIGGSVGDPYTYSTAELESINTLTYSFRPWLTRFEYAFSTCFPRGQFVRFDTAEFVRVDAKTRAEIDALSLGFQQGGWKDRNEVRASYNLEPQKAPVPALTPDTKQQSTPTSDGTHVPKLNGTQTPGTSSASADPNGVDNTRGRWKTNGQNGNGHPVGAMKGN